MGLGRMVAVTGLRDEDSAMKRSGRYSERNLALTGVAQLVGCPPAMRRVTGSSPCQGACLGCRFCLPSGRGGCFSPILMFPSHFLLPFPIH